MTLCASIWCRQCSGSTRDSDLLLSYIVGALVVFAVMSDGNAPVSVVGRLDSEPKSIVQYHLADLCPELRNRASIADSSEVGAEYYCCIGLDALAKGRAR
jgi:hypothetical protein